MSFNIGGRYVLCMCTASSPLNPKAKEVRIFAFGGINREQRTAISAVERAFEVMIVFPGPYGYAMISYLIDRLHLLEKLAGNQRLMLSGILNAFVSHNSRIKGIGEHIADSYVSKRFLAIFLVGNAPVKKKVLDVIQ
ncbi:MAG: hypothetical protein M0Z32_02150 [Actinomycetota bacterium]|nr:hypothetical protein [Actinomycetota bacterium]MCL6093428.1 hypothetical protein [Actinomycetota bacterium]MDA8166541.1 hypothetical protein [Actinomycetota bacterium]